MKTKITIPIMALMLLLAACGKHEQPVGKSASKDRGAVAIPDVLNQTKVNPSDVLTIDRNGNKVTIRWVADFSSCKVIRIVRNDTGVLKNRYTVANLPASAKEYVDSVPEGRAYWYWVAVGIGSGQLKYIGPIRSPADNDNSGNYTKVPQDISFTLQRTEISAVVAWDLPNVKYKTIVIRRNTNPEFQRRRNSRAIVLKTLEWRGDLVDKLPDPNADYWYWIDATQEDGTILSKGPIKAEFAK